MSWILQVEGTFNKTGKACARSVAKAMVHQQCSTSWSLEQRGLAPAVNKGPLKQCNRPDDQMQQAQGGTASYFTQSCSGRLNFQDVCRPTQSWHADETWPHLMAQHG